MPTERIIQILLALAAGAAITLASFALKWVFDANAQMTEMRTTINLKFEQMNQILELKFADIDDSLITLADDTGDITRITQQLQKHWKLHTWVKDQVAELRHKQQLDPVSWPDFD